jgi:quinoprotein glucose dehydrogenase
MRGTPYGVERKLNLSPLGLPCYAPPWGALVGVDLATGEIAFRRPIGTTRDQAPWPFWYEIGTPSMGGPIMTASGLTFLGATTDDYLRAFDSETGEELWRGRLPAGGQATPMTYRLGPSGRQLVVIAAGGHGILHTTPGDAIVAFALP